MKILTALLMLSLVNLSRAFVLKTGVIYSRLARQITPVQVLQVSSRLLSTAPQQTLEELQDGEYYSDDQIIKKSHFIGITKHCTTWDSARQFVHSIRADHPKARHVCFAFVGGFNPKTERCSDDGEPTGTAGPPILGAINGEDISDTVCAVVRYSGGIKLGAGGLIRAYGGTARMALRAAEKKILIPKSAARVSTASSNAGQIYATATKHNGVVEGETYNDLGNLEVTITCDTANFQDMIDDLTDATRGNITFKDS
jgi:uncharacterized YigZ family protein